MPDQPSFVVNDRRKFTAEGELRHDAPASPGPESPVQEADQPGVAGSAQVLQMQSPTPSVVESELADLPESEAIGALYPGGSASDQQESDTEISSPPGEQDVEYGDLPAAPSPEQLAEAAQAYHATVDRLDTAMRAANPGGDRMPPMSFDRLVQSLYTQALLLLGGGAEPGETPRVDILGARQTIDMMGVLEEKTAGNRSDAEEKLLHSALFDLHMGFLEITQALARQAAQRGPGPGAAGGFGMPGGGAGAPTAGGPRIVR